MVAICPNCGREIYTDPNSCVICGWERKSPQPRSAPQTRDYGRAPARQRYPEERPARERARTSPPQSRRAYQERPREDYYRRDTRERRPQYDDRRGYQPQRRREDAYGYDTRREPSPQRREGNFCPNCDNEIFTDPDNCVLCGWSRGDSLGRGRSQEPRRSYPREDRYREEPRRRGPPEDWERRVEERMRERGYQPREERGRHEPYPERRRPEKKETKERYVCDNCGNPSLQFFSDGLGRCPACGNRFRYSTRAATKKMKGKHKQFVCSKCDNKNLQFFLDGNGLCPHCKREFKWKK